MTLTTTHQRMTAAQFAALPEGPPYFQLVGGELFMQLTPPLKHQQLVGNLFFAIATYLAAHPQGTLVLAPSDVELGPDDVYEPDLYFVSNERIGIINEQGACGAPDLVIEVLWPKTARLDYRKRETYGASGVKEMWFASERAQKIEVYTLQGSELTLARTAVPGDTIETPLLPGFTLEVRKVLEL